MEKQRDKKEVKFKKTKITKDKTKKKRIITQVKISSQKQKSIEPKIVISRNAFMLIILALFIANIRQYSYNEDVAVMILSILISIAILVICYFLWSRAKKKEQKKLNKKITEINNYITSHFLRFMLISSIGLIVIVILGLVVFALISR